MGNKYFTYIVVLLILFSQITFQIDRSMGWRPTHWAVDDVDYKGVSWNPDGTQLAVGESLSIYYEGERIYASNIFILDITDITDPSYQWLDSGCGVSQNLEWSTDGRLLVSDCGAVWESVDQQTFEFAYYLPKIDSISTINFNHDGSKIAYIGWNRSIEQRFLNIFDTTIRETIVSIETIETEYYLYDYSILKFSPDGSILAVSRENQIFLINIESLEIIATLDFANANSLSFQQIDSDRSILLVSGPGSIIQWDYIQGVLISEKNEDRIIGPVSWNSNFTILVALSNITTEATRMASPGARSALVWDYHTMTELAVLDDSWLRGARSYAWSPDDTKIAVVDKSISIYSSEESFKRTLWLDLSGLDTPFFTPGTWEEGRGFVSNVHFIYSMIITLIISSYYIKFRKRSIDRR